MRARCLAVLAVALGCGDKAPMERVYPDVADLPEVPALPDPLTTFFEPRPITDADDWNTVRRSELEDLFSHYVYGFTPPPAAVTATEETAPVDLGDGIRHRGIRLTLGDGDVVLHLALFLPADGPPPRVLLALNPCGNHTLLDAPQVRASEAWTATGCPGRGGRAERWPVADIVARGYALATVHESDIDPDDANDERGLDGVHPHFDPGVGVRTRWGRIAAWSWGLSRVVDHLVEAPEVDGRRILVTGHSRRGKAALLAAAKDSRIAAAAPHQSGLVGASPCRDAGGETVTLINLAFPNWFDDVFPQFAGQERKLPVDQHLLLALVAPRPLLVTNGEEDLHADPQGALRAVRAAAPVYDLLGSPGLVEVGGLPTLDGPLSWHQRAGGHALTPDDWSVFMDFADRHLP